jgi:uncharacterized protein YjbI with pentapeptide repeats
LLWVLALSILTVLSVVAMFFTSEPEMLCGDLVHLIHPVGIRAWVTFKINVLLHCRPDEFKTAIAILDLGFVLLLIVWKVPQIQTRRILDIGKRFPAENEARKTMVQIVGGLAVLATIYSIVITAQNSSATLQLAREAQLADRFSKATEQLGATLPGGKKNVDVRIGAIYALEAIAGQSPDYHAEMMEILTAYVRNNSRWNSPCSPQPSSCSARHTQSDVSLEHYRITADSDIQAAIVVLGRRKTEFDSDPRKVVSMVRQLDLSSTDLRGTLLSRGERNLEAADISHSNLEGVNWTGVSMRRADFTGSCMAGARLWASEMEDAQFDDADLTGAYLSDAENTLLHGASFRRASLRCADISADLSGADLTGAHLEGARLKFPNEQAVVSKEQIESACIDEQTNLPDNAVRPPRPPGTSCR